MGLFDRFKKQGEAVTLRKSYTPSVAFADFLFTSGQGDLAAFEAVRLYKKCTPFFQAVSMRSETASSVPINIYSSDGEIAAHDLMRVLRKPNPNQTWETFCRSALSFFDICGESFLMVTRDSRGIPLEVYVLRPQDLQSSATISSMIGVPESWRWQTQIGSETFYLSSDETGGSYRYYSADGSRELWQWSDYNPENGYGNYRGLSKASPLWLQIQQFIEADTNNYSLLRRGSRPSVAWVWQHDQPMTDDQFERWREQVKAYEGAQNAGRQVLVDNLKPEMISVNNRDMEFAANRKTVRADIFSMYSIPLAMVSSENMTMDNLKVSGVQLYDNAVLPLLNGFLSVLSHLLLPYYRDAIGYKIGYSVSDIDALRTREIDSVSLQSKIGVLTDNELRTMLGYESVTGGDVIYKPANLVQVGQDVDTGSNIEEAKKRFVEHMREIKNIDGSRAFSDEYITKSARTHYDG